MYAGMRIYSAYVAAELAEDSQSASLEQEAWRYDRGFLDGFKPGTFEHEWELRLREVLRIELEYSRNEYRRALEMGDGLQARIDKLSPSNDSEQLQHDFLSRRLNLGLAQAGEALNQHAATEAAARAALQYSAKLPNKTLSDRRRHAQAEILLAIALARQGKAEEARSTLAPALALHRELYAREHEDRFQHLELAMALYAAALLEPTQSSTLRGEARALLAAMPTGMRGMRSIAHWQRRIGQ
jgi:tetratricopeptide (TPR) repeat protein